MTDILAKLSAPFPPDAISWRVGSTTKDKLRGMALAYIDARDVQDRLNEVCGLYWQVRPTWAVNGKLACEIGIKVGDEWIWRGDGAGDTDVEAEKGAFSDSFKRAAVRWGIGRYLYDIDSPWVDLEQKGNTHVIKESEKAKLRALLTKSAPPAEPPEKAQARETYAFLAKAIAEATSASDNALGLKVAGTGKDREDVAFVRKWGGNTAADKLHTLAAVKIAELTKPKDKAA